jgi:hypothetical protein
MRTLHTIIFALIHLAVLPALAFAQASITGVVRDTSGAVLPGVTVGASSPVLIEKVRTAVTDGSGQYRIVDLRPGPYSVTFTLPGFSTVKRDGIELAGSFTATVNAEMRVGAVEETITVTGEAPIVDVQTVARQAVMTKEVLDALPAGRNFRLYAVFIPGMSGGGADVGGQTQTTRGTVSIHGGNGNDQRVMVDGVTIRNVAGTGAISNFVPDHGTAQEVTVNYGASSAETMTGGVTFNLIPREGGNRFNGSFFATHVTESFQGNNVTQELTDAGLGVPNRLKVLTDINPTAGGPIRRDKLWFFASGRYQQTDRYVAGLWENLNAGDPTKWTYEPDYAHQTASTLYVLSGNARLTWQATPRNKFNFFFERQKRDEDSNGLPNSNESSFHWGFPRLWFGTASWTSPLTNRLLLEGRLSHRTEDIDNYYPPAGDVYRSLIRVTEQAGIIPGLVYRGKGIPNDTSLGSYRSEDYAEVQMKASMSYVTGAHAFKVGFSNLKGSILIDSRDVDSNTSYRFNNGVPNQIWERQTTFEDLPGGVRAELGVYAQDKWTIKRLTLNPGIRFDYINTGWGDFHLGPTVLLPNRDITFHDETFYNFKDLSPRLGSTYDLRGNGKTAVKVNLGRFIGAVNPTAGNWIAERMIERVTRSWTDANRNYIPDCDLTNPLTQDLRAGGGDFCGTISDLRFGQAISQNNDPATQRGWFQQPYNWEFSAGVQHELAPRMGMEVSYFRRWYGNFTVTDNLAVAATDFTPFSVTAPTDARMPDGGGYVVSGLYNLNPNRVGLVNNYVTLAKNFGERIEHWNGVDVTMNARPREGMLLQGGISTGRTTTDDCDIRASLPEINPVNPFCHVTTAFLTHVKFLGTYLVPKVEVQIAAAFQNLPGPAITNNVIYSNAEVQPSLGRPLSGNAANVTVSVLRPGTMYGERLTELDLRFSKIIRIGQTRVTANLDLYNALNGSAVRTLSSAYNSWLRPTAILDARLVKISGQFDF